MSALAPSRLAVLITLLGPLALPACGGAPQLDGAVYSAQVPVYPKAKLRDVGGGNYYEVVVRKDELEISEVVKPGKRKA